VIDLATRRSAAYWLTLAHHLEVPRRDRNGLVLVADREEHMDLLGLVQRDPDSLSPNLQRFGGALRALLAADAIVSAQAFLVDKLAKSGVRMVPITDPAYPPHLARRLTPAKAPTLLTVRGDVSLLGTPGVAVSGSRKASPRPLAFARAMGGALASTGIPLVCGLAKGVDTEALEGALAAGGRVIGIAAEGILRCAAARRREVEDGRLVVVSQYEPYARWQAWQAMERNRTIAGFSRALVIADCVAEGGTTDQFEVHRELGLPVVVRRGVGEGGLIAELAGRPGASALQWDDGPIVLPAALVGTA
jgi:predicted Rossmann fold nucleotide-binding protein DprA/Smf involved in DNA uptake